MFTIGISLEIRGKDVYPTTLYEALNLEVDCRV